MTHVQFAEGEEAQLINCVAYRVLQLASPRTFNDAWSSFMQCEMDISAAHMNGCPLKLREMLSADVVDLLHDVFGIAAHIDRRTGRIGGGFVPRYAVRNAA